MSYISAYRFNTSKVLYNTIQESTKEKLTNQSSEVTLTITPNVG